MKTKIIPFDLETAKKIQSGEIEGRIVRRGAQKQVCEILEFYAEWQTNCDEKFLIVKVPVHDFEREKLWIYHQDGIAHNAYPGIWYDLVLEVPDNEPQFKPFDKVLVRSHVKDFWKPAIFQYFCESGSFPYKASGEYWLYMIPYEGNERFVGTTDKPNE